MPAGWAPKCCGCTILTALSHFAKYRMNWLLTVSEMLVNLLESPIPIPQRWEKWTRIISRLDRRTLRPVNVVGLLVFSNYSQKMDVHGTFPVFLHLRRKVKKDLSKPYKTWLIVRLILVNNFDHEINSACLNYMSDCSFDCWRRIIDWSISWKLLYTCMS